MNTNIIPHPRRSEAELVDNVFYFPDREAAERYIDEHFRAFPKASAHQTIIGVCIEYNNGIGDRFGPYNDAETGAQVPLKEAVEPEFARAAMTLLAYSPNMAQTNPQEIARTAGQLMASLFAFLGQDLWRVARQRMAELGVPEED